MSWKYKLPIKGLLHQDDNDPGAIRQSGLAIAEAIRNWPGFVDFEELEWIADDLEGAAEVEDRFVQSAMNGVLDELYSVADEYRIWVE